VAAATAAAWLAEIPRLFVTGRLKHAGLFFHPAQVARLCLTRWLKKSVLYSAFAKLPMEHGMRIRRY